MEKIYILKIANFFTTTSINYDTIGCFSSREKAEIELEKLKAIGNVSSENGWDYWTPALSSITEYTIDAEVKLGNK